MLTTLGEEQERKILEELDPIIQKWVKKLNSSGNLRFDGCTVESNVAYLWQQRKDAREEDYRAYLSSNDMGVYGER